MRISHRVNRNAQARRGGRGFTLIEVLIVIIILAILATIVTPQFAGASEAAHNVNLKSQLWRLRGHIEYYDSRHVLDQFDPVNEGWDQLIADEYLDHAPTNPLQDNASTISDAAADGIAWVWTDLGGGEDLYAVNADGDLLLDPETGEPM